MHEKELEERARATAKAINPDDYEAIYRCLIVDLRYAYNIGYQRGKFEAMRRD